MANINDNLIAKYKQMIILFILVINLIHILVQKKLNDNKIRNKFKILLFTKNFFLRI